MKVLIVLGHPHQTSLCAALAEAYARGARAAGAEVSMLRLHQLSFDINYPAEGAPRVPEPELDRARALVAAADHLVFVFPNWWGTMPALLKGFIDRIFTPGFAFNMKDDGTWDKLLTGKSAHVITTMDTPSWVYRWIYGRPGTNALRKATLQFCGIDPVRVTTFGTVFNSSRERRERWIAHAEALGLRLRRGVPDRVEAARAKLLAWVRAMRLQFYPMSWMAYTIGALAAAGGSDAFARPVYWLGYLALFLLEFATVLINEYVDFESDRRNTHYGPFSGGSRVLVDGSLSFAELRQGVLLALAGFALCGYGLAALTALPAPALLLLLMTAAVLCLGYTAPPLKLAYHGLGELDVAVTHSVLLVLIGYLLIGGEAGDAFPWLVSLPLLFSILPAIMLSGVPDYAADKAAGKNTIAVRLGIRRTFDLAMATTVIAAAGAVLWQATGVTGGAYAAASYFVVPHALALLLALRRWRTRVTAPARINSLMVIALTYILWFAGIPLINGA